RDALEELLNATPGLSAAGSIAPSQLPAVASSDPDIVLLDCSLDGGSQTETVQALSAMYPAATLLLMTSCSARDSDELVQELGASGWTSWQLPVADLLRELGGSPEDHLKSGRIEGRRRPDSSLGLAWPLCDLTKRELGVLELLVAGSESEEVATRLGISRHTVRTHVQNIMGKLVVSSKTEMVSVARRAGVGSGPTRSG
ncbi:MAG: LuxR C-terminal-related transcriptional regulator, partial [Acidimicrobiales bacterium]